MLSASAGWGTDVECVVRHGCALVVKMERVTCARWSRSGRASVGAYATCVYSMR